MRPALLHAVYEQADLEGGMQKRPNTSAIVAAAIAIDHDVLVAFLEMYGVGARVV
jgi:hypothetical protein